MPSFATGRTRQFSITGNLKARFLMQHPPPPPPATSVEERSFGRAEFAWSGTSAAQALRAGVSVAHTIINQGQPNATHGYAVFYKLGMQTRTPIFDSEIPEATNFDFSADIGFTISGQLKEMKKVDQTSGYPGGIVDFVPETNLDYYEEFDGDVTLTVTGADPLTVNFSQYQPYIRELRWPGGYSVALRADDNRRAYIMQTPGPISYTTQYNGDAASASVTFFEPLDHPGGERDCANGYWHGKVTTNSDGSSEVALDNPEITISGNQGAGFEVNATAYLVAHPKMDWSLEGNVKQWDEAFGGAVIDDLRNEDTITANGSGLVTRSYTARKYDWSISDDRHPEDWIGGQNADREDLGPGSYRLNAAWIAANAEVTDDWRIMMEDDKSFESFTLGHLPFLTLDDFTAQHWIVEAGAATLSIDGANGLKAEVAEDDTKITQIVFKRLTNYRYLTLRLKADTPLVPVRVWMGSHYWDILIEQANIVEEKTLDLCAAHNIETMDEIRGIVDIEQMSFGGLLAAVTYWFSGLTLERKESALATVLPAFQDANAILTVEIDRKVSLALSYGPSLTELINAIAPGGVGWGYTVTPAIPAHPYYNNELDCAYLYLANPFDQDVRAPVEFRALPLYDGISIYPGVGDLSQAGYGGTFTLEFTKILHGKIDGLVYVRDLYPANILTTTVKVRRDGSDLDTEVTDARRFYRTPHLKAGSCTEVAVIKTAAITEYEKPLPDPTIVNRKVWRTDSRAQVWDKVTELGVDGAELTARRSNACGFGVGTSIGEGLNAIAPLHPCLCPADQVYDVEADAYDYTSKTNVELTVPSSDVVDIDYPLSYSGAIEVTTSPAGATVIAEQGQEPFSGFGSEDSGTSGEAVIYDLDSDNPSTYDIHADSQSTSLASQFDIPIPRPNIKHATTATTSINLGPTGTIQGRVTSGASTPIPGALLDVQQSNGFDQSLHETETDSDGRYTVPNLDVPGDYDVRLVALGYERRNAQITLLSPSPVPVDFQTVRATRIEGSVRATGSLTPIESVTVRAWSGSVERWGVTAADGTYVIDDLPAAGTYNVIASATGWNVPATQVVTVAATQAAIADFLLTPSP